MKNNIQILTNQLTQAETTYRRLANGRELIFSDMSFWNPAELIGHKPSNLAYSLFNELIMKKAWNTGLVPLGYPSFYPSNLMERFLYKPYINVNLAFKTLIPSSISQSTRKTLEEFYLDKLKKYPSLHDKIEFEIVFSCYDFHLKEKLKEVRLPRKEAELLYHTLIMFTSNILSKHKSYYKSYRRLINKLDNYNFSLDSDIVTMLDKCERWGTVPFTTAARLAFIAKTLLQSLVSEEVITPEELNIIMSSFKTVATQLVRDSSSLSLEDFIRKYGHLRSGTYSIEQKRYADISGLLLDSKEVDIKRTKVPESLKRKISIFLSTSPLKITFEELYSFSQLSFSAREYFKFVFTHTISNILETIKENGRQYKLTPEDLSYLSLSEIYNFSTEIHELVCFRRQESKLWNNIILPSIIISPKDFWIISSLQPKPNFITNKNIEGEVILLENTSGIITDKIVLIESADPGFHWIFSKNIKGLVTKYGGVASHMAICCAEFSIPAAIGCGELYDTLKLKSRITLDCTNGVIE